MRLYICRHGKAVDPHTWSGEDKDRPLTDQGIAEVKNHIRELNENGKLEILEIWSSPYLRARQTAQIMADELGLSIKAVPDLKAGAHFDHLAIEYDALTSKPKALLMVGHSPDCHEMASVLTGQLIEPFSTGEITCLEGEFRPRGMHVLWRSPARE